MISLVFTSSGVPFDAHFEKSHDFCKFWGAVWCTFRKIPWFLVVVLYSSSSSSIVLYRNKLLCKKLRPAIFLTDFWHFWGPGGSWGAQTGWNRGCELIPDAPDGPRIAQMAHFEPILGICFTHIFPIIFQYLSIYHNNSSSAQQAFSNVIALQPKSSGVFPSGGKPLPARFRWWWPHHALLIASVRYECCYYYC